MQLPYCILLALLVATSNIQYVFGLKHPFILRSILSPTTHRHSDNSVFSSGIDQNCDRDFLVDAYYKSSNECLDILSSNMKLGLSKEQYVARLNKYGYNTIVGPQRKTLFDLILDSFRDRLVQLLLVIVFMSSIFAFFESSKSAFAEPLAIAAIISFNSAMSVIQSVTSENSLDALKKLHPEEVTVLRDNTWSDRVPSSNIVPGDIISLVAGDKIPADARIIDISTTTFGTDESSLTGESETCFKFVQAINYSADRNLSVSDQKNMVFAGTTVSTGKCIAVVTGTGRYTQIGAIGSSMTNESLENKKTPLTEKLDELTNHLSIIIGSICAVIWMVNIPNFKNPAFKEWYFGALYYSKVAVSLGVAALPEGLPAVITMCLFISSKQLSKKNAVVRKLASVESLGATTTICTDKTGTLTTNQMTVSKLITIVDPTLSSTDNSDLPLKLLCRNVFGETYEPKGFIDNFSAESMSSESLQNMALVCSLCNDAKIIFSDSKFSKIGEPTEAALKVLVEKMGITNEPMNSEDLNAANKCDTYWRGLYSISQVNEFSRDRKIMSVLCRSNAHPSTYRVLAKGAAEVILGLCSHVKTENGTLIEATPAIKEIIRANIQEMCSRALRCIGVAYKNYSVDKEDLTLSRDEIEQNLIFVGYCGILDPPRTEVRNSILSCAQAGIRVIMITGDAKETAISVAKQVGIIKPFEDESNVFYGKDFFQLPLQQQIDRIRLGNKIFYRTESLEKQKLIKVLESIGETAAMTGDGVNDAPALKQASIGIAMGIEGSDVAKESADIILLDDKFSTIVAAVEEGRRIFANMISFVCFLLSCNIGEVVTIFFAALFGLPEPLTPVHLLWVNLVTDGPPAVALSFNPSDPDVMQQSPRNRKDPIMSKWMIVRYCVTGLYVGFATIGIFLWWYFKNGVSPYQLMQWTKCNSLPTETPSHMCTMFSESNSIPQTMALTVLVTIEMLKALSAVSLSSSVFVTPPWKNIWLISACASAFLLHLSILYIPYLATLLRVYPLTVKDWQTVFAFSFPILIVEEVLKFIGRRANSRTNRRQNIAQTSF